MHRINPEKLLRSKWTAIAPKNRERHFIVTTLHRDEEKEHVVEVTLQAVMTHNDYTFAWRDLADDAVWQMGWK
ncbi:TIGR02450 family Trp-rich protein [Cobetia crustatorum]|uniref:TIGR02450 family Trp-rich protein n=1 Tax=Cobetia crustatorum TaxID=553385 RepID=A0A558HLV3_9GAMM|nr:TIGR02450 family Trp-rich protein [Cobetia crustatorum]TVU70095.1 TIGR02450 family Trp-rich protein [Cobetia crustatorum]